MNHLRSMEWMQFGIKLLKNKELKNLPSFDTEFVNIFIYILLVPEKKEPL